jgi:IK cytokine
MKEAKEKEAELALKYRDRAKERRELENKGEETGELASTTSNYRAVAPGFNL